MLTVLIIIAIIAAIAIGYFARINIGLLAFAFAYLIGAFAMELKPAAIIKMWPVGIFFVIFSVSLFYSFAASNGTLEKLAAVLIKKFERMPFLLPYAIFFISALIAAMGAGFYSVLAFMAPITFLLCEKTGLDKVGGAMAINYGALGGANFPTSQSGIIFRGLMEHAQISADDAFINSWVIFACTFILPIVVISLFVLKARKHHTQKLEFAASEPFVAKQKLTLIFMALMMVLVLIFPLLHLAFKENSVIGFINSKIDIGFIAIFFVLLALIFRLGDEKKALSLVPWSTLIMICGVGILVAIATKAGVITQLAAFIHEQIPGFLVPLALMIVAAIMSLFSSTLGVVTPALFPLVPALAQASGYSAAVLFACVVVGAQASAISPFSSGGSLILGACAQEQKDSLLKDLIIKAVPLGFAAALICALILMQF